MHLYGYEITASKIFAIISVSRILQFSAQMLPRSIAEMVSLYNSIIRIEEFLLAEETQHKNITTESESNKAENAVEIKEGNFYI
jgi:hypothetical protein